MKIELLLEGGAPITIYLREMVYLLKTPVI